MQITGRRAVFRTSQLEEAVGEGRNPTANRTMGEIIAARFSRRGFLQGSLAVSAIAATVSPLALLTRRASARSRIGLRLRLHRGRGRRRRDHHHVAEGYDADVLLRWGDPLSPTRRIRPDDADAPRAGASSSATTTTTSASSRSTGSSEHGLLVVNHEYTNPHLMFPGIVTVVAEGRGRSQRRSTKEQVDIEMAAHGGTIVEIAQGRTANGRWCSTASTTAASPPTTRDGAHRPGRRPRAAEDHADPTGTQGARHAQQLRRRHHALGHLRHGRGELPRLLHRRAARRIIAESANYERYGVPEGAYEWAQLLRPLRYLARSRTSRTASAGSSRSTRSIPTAMPKKRTALGRFKHEGAESIVAKDGRVVFYLGDDERFDYVYKFVTAGPSTPTTAPPTWTSSTRARSTSRVRRRRHGRTGCRWSTAQGR